MLKSETVGLAVTLELPLVIVDVQRAGPSTGMPTKPEQADLLMVLFGRNSESPVPVVAASTPSGCFHAAIEAARIAIKYRTPVFLLSDAYLANGSEPWLDPRRRDAAGHLDRVRVQPNGDDGEFLPYQRDPETLARPWAIPGTPGLEHRIGGLEKEDETGNISYDPENHDRMVRLRAAKVAGIAADIPELEVDDPDGADTLVLGWGSTHGAIGAAARRVRASGRKVATAHLHYLNPFPRNTGEVVRAYDKVLIPEMNLGQLRMLIRARVPRRRGRIQQGARASVPGGRARGRDHGAGGLVSDGNGTPRAADREGLQVRPGSSLVPGLRRLRDPQRHPGLHARARLSSASGSCSCPGSAARRASRTTCRPTGCTRSTAARRRSRPASRSTRPDLSVWVVTGDGDALSIGGNHLIHALRRNVNLKILLFNNRIYGLTKGQYSPTSELGKVTKSTPLGSLDHPFNPLSIAIGAEASFVARAIDTDKKGLTEVLGAAARHRGSAFVEILQNCNIYNDGAFDVVREDKDEPHLPRDGQPIRFGAEGERASSRTRTGRSRRRRRRGGRELAARPRRAATASRASRSRCRGSRWETDGAVPLGVFRAVERPVYDELMSEQLEAAREQRGEGDLDALLHSGDTWVVT